MSTDKDEAHWHIDKKVNVGHFLTTLTLAGAMIVWAMTIDSRLAEHEVRIGHNSEAIDSSEARTNKAMDDIHNVANRINDKLDRLIERK